MSSLHIGRHALQLFASRTLARSAINIAGRFRGAIALSDPKSDLARVEITHVKLLDLCFLNFAVFDIPKIIVFAFFDFVIGGD
jgi:hypothetical protein